MDNRQIIHVHLHQENLQYTLNSPSSTTTKRQPWYKQIIHQHAYVTITENLKPVQLSASSSFLPNYQEASIDKEGQT